MSDVSDGSGPVPRRTPRTADGGAPVSGALAIVLAVVAVVAGFFILRSISGDDKKQFDLQSAGTGAAADGDGDTASTTTPISAAVTTALPTTTTLVTTGATVIVANANGKGQKTGEFEGINAPIMVNQIPTQPQTGRLFDVRIGQGILPTGNGEVAKSGIYTNFVDSISGNFADIRGNIVATTAIGWRPAARSSAIAARSAWRCTCCARPVRTPTGSARRFATSRSA